MGEGNSTCPFFSCHNSLVIREERRRERGRGTGADLPNDENGQKEEGKGMMGKRVLVGGGVFNTSDNSRGFLLRRSARKSTSGGMGKNLSIDLIDLNVEYQTIDS